MIRTSITHPLQIASVSAGSSLGDIGITFCPGKIQPSAVTGAWQRDLGIDIDAINDWGAAAVVTLVEQHELAALQVEGLDAAIAAHGMDWLHLPIRDVSVPDKAFEAAWALHGEGLRDRLRSGFNVLVHCKGGLGRAGMITARLLIELGHEPESAIAAVRKVRPGAIETRGQEDYVLGLVAAPDRSPSVDTTAVHDRALGAMLGLAVGDALGTTLEFKRRDVSPLLTDVIGGGPFKLKAGQWTDDTAMALALADSLVHDPELDETDLMNRFVDWQRNGTYSCTGRCFDIGITTSQALARYKQTGDPFAGSTDPDTAGNGSLMRLAPVALQHWNDRASLAGVAAGQSRTTHAAPQAVDACVQFAEILADAIAGEIRSEVLRDRHANGASRAVCEITNGSWRGKPRTEVKSSGYVAHSLEAALWCVGRTADFRSALLLAANLADDADTTAAITGQLAGALYGRSGIPQGWLDKLAWRERLQAAGEALLA
jgi:ADP-ribosyl-[dinitrogen reductase] hydrolase